MLREGIKVVVGWIRRAVTKPFEELDRWQRATRFAYDLGRYGAHQLREDRAPQMAAALSFHTLFGLAPVLVVTTILVKAIRGSDAIVKPIHAVLVAAGLDQVYVPAAEPNGADVTLAAWLERLTGQLANVNLSAIGGVGLAVIVCASIGLMVTIENSFNTIYRAPGGRAWVRRVPLYWFVLTVSPVLVALASYVDVHFNNWIASVATWQWLLATARVLWSLSIVWLLMFAVYTIVPNSTIAIRPALAGSFVAATLLFVGKHTLGAYLGSAFSINQLYGSLGLVPLFMAWVFLMWLGILFGLQVSATLQMLHGRSLEEMDHKDSRVGMVDPVAVLTIMEIVGRRFAEGQPVALRQIAEIVSVPESVVAKIVECLTREGWLHRIEGPETAFSLAKPPEQMNASEFIELGYQMLDDGGSQHLSAMVRQLRDAQRRAADGATLATLLSLSQPTIPSTQA
ncbi:YhjD/YihY/BrkB family envelope integrity protein [Planctomycetota bacterium]